MTGLTGPAGSTHAGLLGLGAYRPRREVPNSEIVHLIDSSDEWIRTRSGITSRRFAGADETVVSMSVEASREAIEQAGLTPDQIDCVLVATVSHLLQTPAAAAMIAEQLGATPAAATDLSAACAGFCYGVAMASDMVRGGSARHVLVVGVEKLSDITDPTDRSTAFIFADGAGAVVIGPADQVGISPVVWGSDGARFDLIRQEAFWPVKVDPDPESVKGAHVLRMDGNPVFRWASFEMAKVAQQAIERAGITADDLDAFIPHQANMRITDAMARALKLPAHVVIARDIAEQGNTSAASVPLAMHRLIADGQVKRGDLALLIAFGAGLVYAAQVVRLP
ncbi:MAG TPA: beta-ketoacyl-ACP synthase III [Nocardioidaceae bacterium]|jgi:3-oxoacyl-(acyl-carrier-protein) synthase III|nr:beta-ketoacyl-ACP synthase III [Nocardioidaceae bacterium]